MINVKCKKCEHQGCESQPAYNRRGETNGRLCVQHKKVGMIDVLNKSCEQDGCQTRPTYNCPGETEGLYCAQHKQAGMTNVKSKRCEHQGCESLNPCFSRPGETSGRFCAQHKQAGMIDVKSKRCERNGCTVRPSCNHSGETVGRFCAQHKEDGMIDVKSRKWEHNRYQKHATFNDDGQRKVRFCAQHKEDGMVDVKSKRCRYDGCTTVNPAYGVPGHRPTYCAKHKEAGMVRNPFTKCMEANCKEPAVFGIQRAVHCGVHMLDGENNLIGRECTLCGLIDVVDETGRCDVCNPEAFRRFRLAKQCEVKLMLERSGHGDFEVYDRVIDAAACGKERPDFMWDCGTHKLVLEVDEDNGHKTRQELCECTRMVNISQSNGLPTVLLRYNPDSYISRGKACNVAIGKPRDVLMRWVANLRSTAPTYFLGVMQLFYDDYVEGREQMVCVLAFDV